MLFRIEGFSNRFKCRQKTLRLYAPTVLARQEAIALLCLKTPTYDYDLVKCSAKAMQQQGKARLWASKLTTESW